MAEEKKADGLIWYLMTVLVSVLIMAGAAWAANVNKKMDTIVGLETKVEIISNDIAAIKNLMIRALDEADERDKLPLIKRTR